MILQLKCRLAYSRLLTISVTIALVAKITLYLRMLKDNHIAAAGGITEAVNRVRGNIPFTTLIEVETETIAQVQEAVQLNLDVIMLDNMPLEMMREAIALIREHSPHTKIEASGNITLTTIGAIAEIGVDYISTSVMVTRSHWLDISMRILAK